MKKKILIIAWILAVSFLAYCFLPIITHDKSKEPVRILIKDRNGIVITDKANEYWYKIDWNIDLNSQFVKDLLKIEDKDYYNHFWVDLASKLWAIKSNILNWKVVSWWSTITEQYIKNKYFINKKRSYLQKSREAFLSLIFNIFPFQGESPKWEGVEYENTKKKSSKDLILSNYLNNIYFWNNLYWAVTASKVYFWKDDINELNQEEITLLISLIHNPWIKSLEEKNFREYFDKIKNKLWYNFDRTIYKLNKHENIDKFPFVTNNINTLYLPLLSKEGTEGWSVTKDIEKESVTKDMENWVKWNKVSIDSNLQQYAKDILNKTLYELKDKNVTNGAIFAINPKTKEVLIYQWSRDYNSTKIDGKVDVIQALRQPWSTMKPFLYLMALENWANPDDLLLDLNNQLNSFTEWKTYISNNYSLKEYWLVRFKKALWNSLNNASVRLAKELWLNKVYDFYKSYWFELAKDPEYYWYSLVLWNPSIKLQDLVMSYAKLIPYVPPLIKESGQGGEVLISKQQEQENQAKFLLYDILSDPDNRDLSFWVNSILNTSIQQAVKTGTSTDFRDNVIVSYHPDFVIWIWVWNNDNSSMIWVSWITWAWYVWHQIIEEAIELWYIKNEKIEIPITVIDSEYCLDEKCFRKEMIYKKEGKEYYSRLLDNYFSNKDLFEKLNSDEIDRLKDFQMYVEE